MSGMGSGARWAAVLVLVAAALAPGCSRPPGEAEEHGAESHDQGRHDELAAGRAVELSPEAVRNAGIRTGVAGPGRLAVTIEAPGEVHLDAERVLEVRPRYPGVVREIRKRIGDPVEKDEVVAVVQSNESLTDYEIASSMPGTVIARPAVTGQAVDHETVLLTLADLSSLRVDFSIYPQHAGRVRAGMAVTVTAQNRPELEATGTIRYVGPLLEQDTRVSRARVVLPNPDGRWQPGLFVTARVTLDRVQVPVAVPEDAIVRTAEGPAVFRAEGARFELRPVRAGRSDGRLTEILDGVAAGDSVVVAGAFVLKSELGKGEAEHGH